MVRYPPRDRARPWLSGASDRVRRTSQSGGVILWLPAFVLFAPLSVPRTETWYLRKHRRDVVIALTDPWARGVRG